MARSFQPRLYRLPAGLVVVGLALGACGEAPEEPQATAEIPPEPEVLAQETVDLKRRVDRLEQGGQRRTSQLNSMDGRLAELSARLAAVEGALGLESGTAAPSAAAPRVAQLEKRLGELESRLAMGGDAGMERTSGDGGSASDDGAAGGLQQLVARQVEAEFDRLLGSQPRQYRVLPAAPAASQGPPAARPVRPEAKRYALHLGSYRHMDSLLTGLGTLRQRHDLLGGLAVTAAEISVAGKGDFLRLLFGEFRQFERAEALCEELANGTYCEVRRLRSVPQVAQAEGAAMGETEVPAPRGEADAAASQGDGTDSGSMESSTTESGAMESGSMESGSTGSDGMASATSDSGAASGTADGGAGTGS